LEPTKPANLGPKSKPRTDAITMHGTDRIEVPGATRLSPGSPRETLDGAMSTFQALALIIGGTASAIYLLIMLQREIRSLELVLETGLEEGVPVTVE
jgi:hypothetical protein